MKLEAVAKQSYSSLAKKTNHTSRDDNCTSFSHSLRVLFINAIDCNKAHALELFTIFFSNIDIAYSKEEALELFHNSKYDLIITGLNIPNIDDGIRFIEDIRAITQDITILTIASGLNQFEFTKLIELGIDGFIIKPVYIKQFSDVIHKTLEKLKNKDELNQYRINLENQVKTQVEQLRQKDQLLFQQSKLAAMGEMMDAVAHQWAQPISIIQMKVDFLEYAYIDKLIDKDYIMQYKKKVLAQVDHMKSTLSEFRNFFRPTQKQEEFDVKSMISKVLLLIKDEFIKNNINILVEEKQNFQLIGIENEFKHLILNIVNNSKDAFIENNNKDRQITITISQNTIDIQDNAGGIPQELLGDIFKANITSKEEGKGTGIGLYMSDQIAQKYHGKLSVANIQNGVKFTFCLNNPI